LELVGVVIIKTSMATFLWEPVIRVAMEYRCP